MIIPGMYLGNTVDGEPDGQPDSQALGDDTDILYPPPNDDEDGVTFKTALIPGQSAIIDVVVSQTGFLQAWIDFNQMNSWNDPTDQILMDFPLNPRIEYNPISGSGWGANRNYFCPLQIQHDDRIRLFRLCS